MLPGLSRLFQPGMQFVEGKGTTITESIFAAKRDAPTKTFSDEGSVFGTIRFWLHTHKRDAERV